MLHREREKLGHWTHTQTTTFLFALNRMREGNLLLLLPSFLSPHLLFSPPSAKAGATRDDHSASAQEDI